MRSTPWVACCATVCLLALLAGCKKNSELAEAPVAAAPEAPAAPATPAAPPVGSERPSGDLPLETLPDTVEISGSRTPASSQEIYYNAKFSPHYAATPSNAAATTLPYGKTASLQFGIGPQIADSVLSRIRPSPDIALSTEDVPMTVVLHCSFCDPNAESLKTMTFRIKAGKSEDVVFQFTPLQKPGLATYKDKLHLAIINDKTGRAFDRLTIPVTIVANNAASATTAAPMLALRQPNGDDEDDWESDVVLYAQAESNDKVTVSVHPVSQKMKALLSDLAYDGEGKRRVFRSGVRDPNLVSAMSNSAYGAMSAVSMQGAQLKKFSANGTNAIVSEASRQSLKLADNEEKGVVGVLGNIGQRLHRQLFGAKAQSDLRTLITRMENAAAQSGKPDDRPLRLTIVTDDLSLPWQYLHPQGDKVEVDRFWGMRFSISVQRVSNGASGKGSSAEAAGPRKVIFAQYGADTDESIPHAKLQLEQLKSIYKNKPRANVDLRRVRSGSQLLSEMTSGRKEIAAIVTFLHASAGTANDPPYLEFNKGDIVTSDSLEGLLNAVSVDDELDFLSRGPLVILNACETGPARKMPYVALEDALFQLGVRGVIATEVSVWISLGHEVTTLLLKRLEQGASISDALTAVRRELYLKKKNPLGLLYVYYGDPAAMLHQ